MHVLIFPFDAYSLHSTTSRMPAPLLDAEREKRDPPLTFPFAITRNDQVVNLEELFPRPKLKAGELASVLGATFAYNDDSKPSRATAVDSIGRLPKPRTGAYKYPVLNGNPGTTIDWNSIWLALFLFLSPKKLMVFARRMNTVQYRGAGKVKETGKAHHGKSVERFLDTAKRQIDFDKEAKIDLLKLLGEMYTEAYRRAKKEVLSDENKLQAPLRRQYIRERKEGFAAKKEQAKKDKIARHKKRLEERRQKERDRQRRTQVRNAEWSGVTDPEIRMAASTSAERRARSKAQKKLREAYRRARLATVGEWAGWTDEMRAQARAIRKAADEREKAGLTRLTSKMRKDSARLKAAAKKNAKRDQQLLARLSVEEQQNMAELEAARQDGMLTSAQERRYNSLRAQASKLARQGQP